LTEDIRERARNFLVVGENIHATRSLRLDGKRIERSPDGAEAVRFTLGGERRLLPIPESYRAPEHYGAGRVRHIAIALSLARSPAPEERQRGLDYLRAVAEAQTRKGARWLDLNVDEISPDPAEQTGAMEFLARAVGALSSVPLSIDSSNVATLRAGLALCDRARGRPMLNSVALDRPETLDLAAEGGLEIVASAAGPGGIPQDLDGRRENIRKIISLLEQRDVPRSSIHIDPLVMPASAVPGSGAVVVECVRWIREEFGEEIHITGGFSNVSFGMPARDFLNLVMLRLVMEAGADAGVIDPVRISPEQAAGIEMESEPARLAVKALTAEDMMASLDYLQAAQEGKLPRV